MAKLTDTQKSMVILGGGIFFALGAGAAIYFDLQAKGEVDAEIATQREEKSKNQKIIDKIPGLKKSLVAYKKMVTDNARILPTDDDINNFVRDLSNLEKEAGITYKTLPNYRPEQDKRVASITRIPMKLQLNASTRAFLRFLNQLESRERLISVTDFRISPSSTEAKPGQEIEHDIGVSFEMYRYDPKAGPTSDFPIKGDEELQLLESADVKNEIAAKGKPASIERYQLMPGRENRRDMFIDPRRRVGGKDSDKGKDDIRIVEEALLEALRLKLEKARLEGEAYRSAEQAKDFLRMAAAKRSFLKAKEELEDEIRKVSANNPEFKSRDLQDAYVVEVRRPYEKLMTDYADIIGTSGGREPIRITEVMARGFHKDMKDLHDLRKFTEASEKWAGIESILNEAGKNVEEGAKPVVEDMRRMGAHAANQALLALKKLEIQGIVRMGKGSAVIISVAGAPGKIVFQDKNVDKDLVFVRVEEGGKGETDRLIFKINGHEVDYVQAKPQLLDQNRDVLTQD